MLPSVLAMLYVFVMVIRFMITKFGHLHKTISQGVGNLPNIYFCNKNSGFATKKACMQ
jgi:hypothetical protein